MLIPRTVDVPHLVGVAEIGAFLGVSKQRVHQLTDEAFYPERAPRGRPLFPAPAQLLAAGAVWALDDIRLWAEMSEREVGDEALAAFEGERPWRQGKA